MLECDIERQLLQQAEKIIAVLVEKLKSLSVTLVLAESCTCGLVSSMLANVPGVSNVLWGSFVCYTKEAKIKMLGLDETEIGNNGLVSSYTAEKMADLALEKSGAQISAAVTGLAGPAGDGSDVPVGTVWIAVVKNGASSVSDFHFLGSRNEIRIQAAIAVLNKVLDII